ncbi:MAG TPA: NTP transferase domain-containing protein [Candidatus Eremiobacteraceae bacterium]|nr:NTP transferase domain-containing protein [Candidatus Eremiobacteraceae bacterium]
MRDRAKAALSIGCSVLAAGAGARFGTPGEKLVAMTMGKRLAQHAIDAAAASSASRCSLIVGAGAERVLAVVDARRLAVYTNDRWETGIASSIALAALTHAQDDAFVLLLADAPRVTTVDIDALIAAWLKRPDHPAALRSGAVWGSPAIFPRSTYAALARLRGDRGAKGAVLRDGRVTLVNASTRAALADVDRRRDISRLNARRTK